MSDLTRASMGEVRAAKFDAVVTSAVRGHIQGRIVESMIFVTVAWGDVAC